MRVIEVVEYQASWPSEFDREKELILDTIGSLSPEVHHIGSTSVTGLSAKPIIDILVEVDDLDELDSFNDALAKIGYTAKGENEIAERRYFEKGGDFRSHHMHAFLRSSENSRRHIAFRDYLQQDNIIAQEYAILKKSVAHSCNHDNDKYCNGKNKFIQYHEKQAIEWHALNK
ncbi:GrpB family protein [Microbulbifer sp. 2304DJ12-6]|uniref:GrpB family protein n=1 Tax=Microbulbifer sp. 2304DJ12-6 TaxID=3233340 RepID=UPI0039AEDFCA